MSVRQSKIDVLLNSKVLPVALRAMNDADYGKGEKKTVRSPTHNQQESAQLDEDYAAIASLMEDLDLLVSNFVGNVNKAVDSAPAYDSLTTLWREMSESQRETSSSSAARLIPQQAEDTSVIGNEDLILADEAEDPNDPLVFI